MAERVILLVAILLFVAVAFPALLRLRDRPFLRRRADVPGPAVVAFTHARCGPCRTQQLPALERLRALSPEVRIEVVDVQQDPQRARWYGIWTVPATVVVDPSGRITALNHGVADERRLLRQLARFHPQSRALARA